MGFRKKPHLWQWCIMSLLPCNQTMLLKVLTVHFTFSVTATVNHVLPLGLCLKFTGSSIFKTPLTHPVVQVLGQCVYEYHLASGCSSIQADWGIEVVVPKHGAAQQSDKQGHNQHRQQGDKPAEQCYTCGAGQVSNIAPTLETQRQETN